MKHTSSAQNRLDPQLSGAFVLFGALAGFVCAVNVAFVPPNVRAMEGDAGPEFSKLCTMAAIITPLLTAGSALLAAVPSVGISHGGYAVKFNVGLILVSFSVAGCVTVGVYMTAVAIEDFMGNRPNRIPSALGHASAAIGTLGYLFLAYQLHDVLETKAIRRRGTSQIDKRKSNEMKIRRMMADGTLPPDITIIDGPIDDKDLKRFMSTSKYT